MFNVDCTLVHDLDVFYHALVCVSVYSCEWVLYGFKLLAGSVSSCMVELINYWLVQQAVGEIEIEHGQEGLTVSSPGPKNTQHSSHTHSYTSCCQKVFFSSKSPPNLIWSMSTLNSRLISHSFWLHMLTHITTHIVITVLCALTKSQNKKLVIWMFLIICNFLSKSLFEICCSN